MSGHRIQKALQKWKVIPMKAGSYWFADIDDPDLAKLLDAYDLELAKKLYTEGELRRLKNRSRPSRYVYVRCIILNQSSKNIDKYDVFGRFTFYKVAKSGYNIL